MVRSLLRLGLSTSVLACALVAIGYDHAWAQLGMRGPPMMPQSSAPSAMPPPPPSPPAILPPPPPAPSAAPSVQGFPGPSSLMEVFTGRYSALPWFAEGEEAKYLEANRGG